MPRLLSPMSNVMKDVDASIHAVMAINTMACIHGLMTLLLVFVMRQHLLLTLHPSVPPSSMMHGQRSQACVKPGKQKPSFQ